GKEYKGSLYKIIIPVFKKGTTEIRIYEVDVEPKLMSSPESIRKFLANNPMFMLGGLPHTVLKNGRIEKYYFNSFRLKTKNEKLLPLYREEEQFVYINGEQVFIGYGTFPDIWKPSRGWFDRLWENNLFLQFIGRSEKQITTLANRDNLSESAVLEMISNLPYQLFSEQEKQNKAKEIADVINRAVNKEEAINGVVAAIGINSITEHDFNNLVLEVRQLLNRTFDLQVNDIRELLSVKSHGLSPSVLSAFVTDFKNGRSVGEMCEHLMLAGLITPKDQALLQDIALPEQSIAWTSQELVENLEQKFNLKLNTEQADSFITEIRKKSAFPSLVITKYFGKQPYLINEKQAFRDIKLNTFDIMRIFNGIPGLKDKYSIAEIDQFIKIIQQGKGLFAAFNFLRIDPFVTAGLRELIADTSSEIGPYSEAKSQLPEFRDYTKQQRDLEPDLRDQLKQTDHKEKWENLKFIISLAVVALIYLGGVFKYFPGLRRVFKRSSEKRSSGGGGDDADPNLKKEPEPLLDEHLGINNLLDDYLLLSATKADQQSIREKLLAKLSKEADKQKLSKKLDELSESKNFLKNNEIKGEIVNLLIEPEIMNSKQEILAILSKISNLIEQGKSVEEIVAFIEKHLNEENKNIALGIKNLLIILKTDHEPKTVQKPIFKIKILNEIFEGLKKQIETEDLPPLSFDHLMTRVFNESVRRAFTPIIDGYFERLGVKKTGKKVKGTDVEEREYAQLLLGGRKLSALDNNFKTIKTSAYDLVTNKMLDKITANLARGIPACRKRDSLNFTNREGMDDDLWFKSEIARADDVVEYQAWFGALELEKQELNQEKDAKEALIKEDAKDKPIEKIKRSLKNRKYKKRIEEIKQRLEKIDERMKKLEKEWEASKENRFNEELNAYTLWVDIPLEEQFRREFFLYLAGGVQGLEVWMQCMLKRSVALDQQNRSEDIINQITDESDFWQFILADQMFKLKTLTRTDRHQARVVFEETAFIQLIDYFNQQDKDCLRELNLTLGFLREKTDGFIGVDVEQVKEDTGFDLRDKAQDDKCVIDLEINGKPLGYRLIRDIFMNMMADPGKRNLNPAGRNLIQNIVDVYFLPFALKNFYADKGIKKAYMSFPIVFVRPLRLLRIAVVIWSNYWTWKQTVLLAAAPLFFGFIGLPLEVVLIPGIFFGVILLLHSVMGGIKTKRFQTISLWIDRHTSGPRGLYDFAIDQLLRPEVKGTHIEQGISTGMTEDEWMKLSPQDKANVIKGMRFFIKYGFIMPRLWDVALVWGMFVATYLISASFTLPVFLVFAGFFGVFWVYQMREKGKIFSVPAFFNVFLPTISWLFAFPALQGVSGLAGWEFFILIALPAQLVLFLFNIMVLRTGVYIGERNVNRKTVNEKQMYMVSYDSEINTALDMLSGMEKKVKKERSFGKGDFFNLALFAIAYLGLECAFLAGMLNIDALILGGFLVTANVLMWLNVILTRAKLLQNSTHFENFSLTALKETEQDIKPTIEQERRAKEIFRLSVNALYYGDKIKIETREKLLNFEHIDPKKLNPETKLRIKRMLNTFYRLDAKEALKYALSWMERPVNSIMHQSGAEIYKYHWEGKENHSSASVGLGLIDDVEGKKHLRKGSGRPAYPTELYNLVVNICPDDWENFVYRFVDELQIEDKPKSLELIEKMLKQKFSNHKTALEFLKELEKDFSLPKNKLKEQIVDWANMRLNTMYRTFEGVNRMRAAYRELAQKQLANPLFNDLNQIYGPLGLKRAELVSKLEKYFKDSKQPKLKEALWRTHWYFLGWVFNDPERKKELIKAIKFSEEEKAFLGLEAEYEKTAQEKLYMTLNGNDKVAVFFSRPENEGFHRWLTLAPRAGINFVNEFIYFGKPSVVAGFLRYRAALSTRLDAIMEVFPEEAWWLPRLVDRMSAANTAGHVFGMYTADAKLSRVGHSFNYGEQTWTQFVQLWMMVVGQVGQYGKFMQKDAYEERYGNMPFTRNAEDLSEAFSFLAMGAYMPYTQLMLIGCAKPVTHATAMNPERKYAGDFYEMIHDYFGQNFMFSQKVPLNWKLTQTYNTGAFYGLKPLVMISNVLFTVLGIILFLNPMHSIPYPFLFIGIMYLFAQAINLNTIYMLNKQMGTPFGLRNFIYGLIFNPGFLWFYTSMIPQYDDSIKTDLLKGRAKFPLSARVPANMSELYTQIYQRCKHGMRISAAILPALIILAPYHPSTFTAIHIIYILMIVSWIIGPYLFNARPVFKGKWENFGAASLSTGASFLLGVVSWLFISEPTGLLFFILAVFSAVPALSGIVGHFFKKKSFLKFKQVVDAPLIVGMGLVFLFTLQPFALLPLVVWMGADANKRAWAADVFIGGFGHGFGLALRDNLKWVWKYRISWIPMSILLGFSLLFGWTVVSLGVFFGWFGVRELV
ncbi:MAG: hypothetical protein DRP78_04205, partial [Candidatus Omnitrophota bacterium]